MTHVKEIVYEHNTICNKCTIKKRKKNLKSEDWPNTKKLSTTVEAHVSTTKY